MKLVLTLICSVALAGCAHLSDKSDVNVEIQRFDKAVETKPADSVVALMEPAVLALRSLGQDTSLSLSQVVEAYKGSAATKVFEPDVAKRLPDVSGQEKILGTAFGNMKALLPEVELPKHLYGYVTPYMQSVVIVDSVMFVGLNHYLGADYPGYDGFGEYLKQLKVGGRIPLDIVEALVCSTFPYHGGIDATVLSRMLYEGGVVYALKSVMPDACDADLLGMTKEQLQWAEANEGLVWRLLAEKGLLYSTDPLVASKLINPAPNSAIVHIDAAGRIGRFIGYKIVQEYEKKHDKVRLQELLNPGFYDSQTTLPESGYSPK